ncbi:MAG: ribonuclease, partial [Clostridia bacterium]|nr:ribonuclease [Clostridia bacterium]
MQKKRDDTMKLEENTPKTLTRKQVIIDMMKHPGYVPMKIKEIVAVLQVPDEDRPELEELLGELIKEGKIIRTKRGKFAVPQTFNLV